MYLPGLWEEVRRLGNLYITTIPWAAKSRDLSAPPLPPAPHPGRRWGQLEWAMSALALGRHWPFISSWPGGSACISQTLEQLSTESHFQVSVENSTLKLGYFENFIKGGRSLKQCWDGAFTRTQGRHNHVQGTARRELRGFQVEGHGLHSWYFPVMFYVENFILNVPCLKLQSIMGLLFWKVHKRIILLALDNLIIF